MDDSHTPIAAQPWAARLRVAALTALALLAFAANSVLCRLALAQGQIDAAGFTTVRLASAVLVLGLIVTLRGRGQRLRPPTRWRPPMFLFIYAVAFSYAYIDLPAATGALVLFGAVQITMLAVATVQGHRLKAIEWFGAVLAFAGLVYLNLPGAQAPSLTGFILMTLAGAAWGLYTLAGRHSARPLADTAANFTATLPLALLLLVLALQANAWSLPGVLLAAASGGLASGLGYVIWYAALGALSPAQAAVLQLLVPILAGAGGVVFLAEAVTARLVFSAIMVLGGVLLVLRGRYRTN